MPHPKWCIVQLTGNGKNTIDTALKNKKQSNNFILDISNTSLELEQIIKDIDNSFTHREHLDEVHLIKDGKIIADLKRK